jgi:hypothetical protein
MRYVGMSVLAMSTLCAVSLLASSTAHNGTHNIGLIGDRIAGLIFWSAGAIIGTIMVVGERGGRS